MVTLAEPAAAEYGDTNISITVDQSPDEILGGEVVT